MINDNESIRYKLYNVQKAFCSPAFQIRRTKNEIYIIIHQQRTIHNKYCNDAWRIAKKDCKPVCVQNGRAQKIINNVLKITDNLLQYM
jgi:hypothetical protein